MILVLAALTTFRVSWFFVCDDLGEPIRSLVLKLAVRARRLDADFYDLHDHQRPDLVFAAWFWPWLERMLDCVWCTSVWIGLPVAVLVGGPWRVVVLGWLSFSAVAGVLAETMKALRSVASDD